MKKGAWYGLTSDGIQQVVPELEMFRWAFRKGVAVEVGQSDHYTMPEGTRLVRGETCEQIVENAVKAGWDDNANMLSKMFLVAV